MTKILLPILILLSFNIPGQNTHNTKKGVAIEGYDPVSYFNKTPTIGLEKYDWSNDGVTYLFATKDNLDLFTHNPKKYQPQYGGWCAYAMGVSGDKVKVDPKTYKIKDGRLYLFYNFKNNNTLTLWNKNENTLISDADDYWMKIIK